MKVLVLLSGGIDSATVLAKLRDHDREALAFDYDQPHAIELDYARRIAEREGVSLRVMRLPRMRKVDDVVFAGRNAALISLAVAVAAGEGFDAVAIGCNFSDWERFPDCRPDFVTGLGKVLREAYGVAVVAPLLRMSKAQVVQEARRLGVPLDETWSCYSPKDAKPCGGCLACEVRAKAGA
jgi:7-cyano-7-deazaguanine synthase